MLNEKKTRLIGRREMKNEQIHRINIRSKNCLLILFLRFSAFFMARSDGVTNFYGKIACFIFLAIFKEKPLGMLHLLDREREINF